MSQRADMRPPRRTDTGDLARATAPGRLGYPPISRLVLLLVVLLAAISMPAALARADQMTVFSCHDPAENAVGHDGWTMARTSDEFMTLADTCAAGGQGDLVLELAANGSGYRNAARAEWVFTAPPWATIAHYTIQVPDSYTYPWAGAGEGQTFVEASDESDPAYDYRNLGAGSWGAATISRTPTDPVSRIVVNASCDGEDGPCPAGVTISHIDVSSAQVVLNDSTTPTVSDLVGSLVSGAGVRGTAEVAFNAADGGPGVYSGQLIVDGQSQPAVVLNSNNGWCQDLGHTSDGTRSFSHPDPCAQSTSGSVTLDTTGLSDGQHTLKLVVDDAAGDATTAYDGTITTDNAPANTSAPAILAPTQVFDEGALSTQPGAWSAPSGAGHVAYGYGWEDCDSEGNGCQAIAGAQSASYTPVPGDVGHTLRVLVTASDNDGSTQVASAATSAVASTATSTVVSPQGSLGALPGPGTSGGAAAAGLATAGSGAANGTGASETARLDLGVHRAISRSFARRAFKLTGRLLDGQGHPIANAALDVLQQTAGGPMRVIAHARTGAEGTFVVTVPAGPSRVVDVAYRAFSGDAGYAAQAKIGESVGAGVRLSVTPRRTGSTGTVVLTGRVLGPIPPQGTIVDLLVHYRGRWEPFRTPRTDSDGRFQVVYQFEGGVGRFPFRAEVPAGQAGFPFAGGYSNVIDVATG